MIEPKGFVSGMMSLVDVMISFRMMGRLPLSHVKKCFFFSFFFFFDPSIQAIGILLLYFISPKVERRRSKSKEVTRAALGYYWYG